LIEININTFNISAEALEQAILRTIEEGKFTPKVSIPVDLFGLSPDYSKIEPIAKKYGLKILEDAAQALVETSTERISAHSGMFLQRLSF